MGQTLDHLTSTLGANARAYGEAADLQAEEDEFQWAAAKRARVVQAVRTLPPLDATGGLAVGRAADIGCRGGREAAFYRDACGIGAMHGFEIAAGPLARAAERGIVPHVWVSGAQPCPVPDGYFDLILALDVIEHLFDTDIFLTELRRAVRPGGHVLVATPNLAWWWNRGRLLRGAAPAGLGATSPTQALDPVVDVKHLRVNVAAEWLHLFAARGFACVGRWGYNYPRLLRGPFRPIDRALCAVPTLACSIIFVLRRPD